MNQNALSSFRSAFKRDWEEIVDYLLLVAVLGLPYYFTIERLTSRDTGFPFYLPNLYRDLTDTNPLYIVLPLCLAYWALVTLFVLRRKDATGKKIPPVFAFIFAAYVVFKVISVFSFPYGNAPFSFDFRGNTYDVVYPGFTPEQRFTELFHALSLAYGLLAAFSYGNSFHSYSARVMFHMVMWYFIVYALVLIFWSFFNEGSKFSNNFRALFDSNYGIDTSIKSLTGQRNVFGFKILLGLVAVSYLCYDHPHWAYFLLMGFFLVVNLLIFSRTSFYIDIALFLQFLLCSVFTSVRKKNRPYFLFTLSSLILFFLIVLAVLIANGVSPSFHEALARNFAAMTDGSTMNARKNLRDYALSIFSAYPQFALFGYGVLPYKVLLHLFHVSAHAAEDLLHAHCGLIDVLVKEGVLGTLLFSCLYAYLFYQCWALFKKRGQVLGLYLMGTIVLLLVYCFIEPRMMFTLQTDSAYMSFVYFLGVEHALCRYGLYDHPEEICLSRKKAV